MPINVERRKLQNWTFVVLFGATVYLFWLVAQPLWVPIFLGMLIAMAMHPLHKRFLRRSPRRGMLSAAVLTGLVISVSLGLIGFFAVAVLGQLLEMARDTSNLYQQGGSTAVVGVRLQAFLTSIGQDPARLSTELASVTESFAKSLGGSASRLFAASMSGILAIVFTAITSYYLLHQGARLSDWFVGALPLPDSQGQELVENFRDVTRAMLLGTGVTALYQAVAAFLGYWIAGVPRPVVWAVLTGIASVVPAGGAGLIWVPIAGWLLFTGHLVGGAALGVYCFAAVNILATYVLRPRLLGSMVRMNDLLVFIALFGGVQAFGFLGIILGPIVTALLVSLVRIYERDYRQAPPVGRAA